MAEPLFMLLTEWSDVLHCLRETAESDKARAKMLRETADGDRLVSPGSDDARRLRRLAISFEKQAARFLALESELKSPNDKIGRTYF